MEGWRVAGRGRIVDCWEVQRWWKLVGCRSGGV